MKPTFQFNDAYRQRDSFAFSQKDSTAPKVDYNLQKTGADFSGRCQGKGCPSFRGISNDYFKHEARSHFASEAAVFGVIVITAAIPVVEGIRGLVHFVYGIL